MKHYPSAVRANGPPVRSFVANVMNVVLSSTLLVATITGPLTAWIGKDAPQTISCVDVVVEFREDLAGHPERLADYLDPGADGLTVLSRDQRAPRCGIDQTDLERWAATK